MKAVLIITLIVVAMIWILLIACFINKKFFHGDWEERVESWAWILGLIAVFGLGYILLSI